MPKNSFRLISATCLVGMLVVGSSAVFADPPPWAPAHGWRQKHDPYYVGYTGTQWPHDYGITGGRCNWQAVGTIVGGMVGGAVGAQVSKGEGRTAAILVGSVLGAAIGNQIGREIDEQDRACIGQALELAPDNQRVSWQNPQTGVAYVLTPLGWGERKGGQPAGSMSFASPPQDTLMGCVRNHTPWAGGAQGGSLPGV